MIPANSNEIGIRPASAGDAAALAQIYNHYIRNTYVTFETDEIDADEMGRRVQDGTAQGLPWLVAESGSTVIGYAYATRWKDRSAYQHSIETTIYLDSGHTSDGVGTALYSVLLNAVSELPIRSVIGGIALPNKASVRLHERLGFVKVAHFDEVGRKFDRWIDVGYWQLLI